MKKIVFILGVLLIFSNLSTAQESKSLDIDDLIAWPAITAKGISNDGGWSYAELSRFRGDGWLDLYNNSTGKTIKFLRGYSASFAPESKFLIFKVKPQYDSVRAFKIKKVPSEELPKDSLFVFNLQNKEVRKFDKIKSYTLPKDKGQYVLFLQFPDSAKKSDDFYNLKLLDLAHNTLWSADSVKKAAISDNGKFFAYVRKLKDSMVLYVRDAKRPSKLYASYSAVDIDKIKFNKSGEEIAFLSSDDTTKNKVYSLFLLETLTGKAQVIASKQADFMPENWAPSINADIYFSDDNSKLFYGVAPIEKQEEDTIPDDEKIRVDLWSWTDSILMPQQLINRDEDLKRTFLTVYFIRSERNVIVQDKFVDYVKLVKGKNADYALGAVSAPYARSYSWSYPFYEDYYLIDLKTGKRTLIAKQIDRAILSPQAKYVVWYSHQDSCWYSYNISAQKTIKLLDNSQDYFYNVENDVPAPADAYGSAGFIKNDKYFLVYGQYDVWAVDPSGKQPAFNITQKANFSGKLRFRVHDLNRETPYLDDYGLFFVAFETETKDGGYFWSKDLKHEPKKLVFSANRYFWPTKARDADVLLWQKSAVDLYPDLYISPLDFGKTLRLSNYTSLQKQYNWATVELFKWQTPYGEEEGLLYKPQNFDPEKKYPVIVYFYERNSANFHTYYLPRPSRSIINPVHYASNGYIVFVPNIRYKTGYPGKSAYDYVVSGTLSLIERYNWVDKGHIGVQGQSWGGYQTAYLITQTDIFAAAEAGAPVSNMTSAYGGIRWGTGMSREFQYETTQSRIGGNLWDKLPLYMQNSPLFYAPNVKTPLLIMHNDNDGAVPWYQGIEMFMALRRLNKPVWLLNYNGQPHNLSANTQDRVDLTIRMMQFFDHYLKGAPEPYWMKYGIPAVKKGKTLGYELVK